MWQNLLLKRGNAEKQKSELSCEWERQKNLTYLYAIGCGAGWADLRPSSVLVCGSHGYTGVQDTFSTWYLQRFPGFSLPWVSLISLNESLKFFRDTGIFFPPLWHSGTQRMWKDHLPFPSNVSNPINTPAPLQSPVLLLQSLQWTPEFTSLPFPPNLSLPFISVSVLIYSGFEKERFEEQVLNASKSIIFWGKL